MSEKKDMSFLEHLEELRGRLVKSVAGVIVGIIVVVSFCTPGPYITEPDYKSYFYWPLFAAVLHTGGAAALFTTMVWLLCVARKLKSV